MGKETDTNGEPQEVESAGARLLRLVGAEVVIHAPVTLRSGETVDAETFLDHCQPAVDAFTAFESLDPAAEGYQQEHDEQLAGLRIMISLMTGRELPPMTEQVLPSE